MLKRILTLIVFTTLIWLQTGIIAHAAKPTLEEYFPTPKSTNSATADKAEKKLLNGLDDAVKKELSGQPSTPTNDQKLTTDEVNALINSYAEQDTYKLIGKLPQGTESSIIAGIIRVILAIGGTLATIGMLVAGIMYITAQDSEDQTGKAKKILIYSIIGLIVISVSYAIFTGLATLVFNN